MASKQTPVGYEFPPQEVSWLKRDLLLFANTIGCEKDELHFLFELHPEFAAFPTYPVVLPFKLNGQEVSDTMERISRLQVPPGGPSLDVSRYVDAGRYLTLLRPLPITSTGRSFTLNQKCLGIYDKGEHTVRAFETKLVDTASGEVYARFRNTGLALGQGGWGGPKGPPPNRYPPPGTRLADYIFEINISQEASFFYRLNGDYHPHNVDPEEARRTGFPRPFYPGLGTWNITAHTLLRALCKSDPTRLRTFGARFTGVVFPGDRLLVEIWLLRPEEIGFGNEYESFRQDQEGWDEARFRVKVGKKVVLSDGRAVIKVENPRDGRSGKLKSDNFLNKQRTHPGYAVLAPLK